MLNKTVEGGMIILKRESLDNYLQAINKNYAWLSLRMGYTRGYISQIINDGCKISAPVVDKMLHITQMNFSDLFLNNGEPDLREFYGEVFTVDGKPVTRKKYYGIMRQKRLEMSENNKF